MSEKIKCPERDSNPWHPDLMEGALTTELPRQPQWSESNICYKRNIDYQTFAPRPLGLGITSVGRRDEAHRTRCYRPLQMYVIRHISNKCSSSIREVNSLMMNTCSKYAVLRTLRKVLAKVDTGRKRKGVFPFPSPIARASLRTKCLFVLYVAL